jgi:hypothetical protein
VFAPRVFPVWEYSYMLHNCSLEGKPGTSPSSFVFPIMGSMSWDLGNSANFAANFCTIGVDWLSRQRFGYGDRIAGDDRVDSRYTLKQAGSGFELVTPEAAPCCNTLGRPPDFDPLQH